LGFSDGYGGYGGGFSFTHATSNSTKTLLDMNGDGKPDLVYFDSSAKEIKVN
jgi:hypothetical protein